MQKVVIYVVLPKAIVTRGDDEMTTRSHKMVFDQEEKILIQNLGIRIAKLRSEQNMARAELARQSGLHVQYLFDVETGKRNMTIYVLCKIAKALNIHVSELVKECDLSTK